MTTRLTAAIVGGSGYAGGELLRLLLHHPNVDVTQITSDRLTGRGVGKAHPNLRKLSDLSFIASADVQPCDVLFCCLRHGDSMRQIPALSEKAGKIIDLSADFRLSNPSDYQTWYGHEHTAPDLLSEFVYGVCELHRDRMATARFVSSAGCNATATILGLYPLFAADVVDPDRTVVEVKVGSSEGGGSASDASHHPERAGCVRSFMPTAHRHTAEIVQALSIHRPVKIHFSATSIDMVRGVLATAHVFLKDRMSDRDLWSIYRRHYADEPFVRIIKERDGLYRYPEPKLLAGTNYCDVGFACDPHDRRVVVISAIDNLVKGAAGQAVQACNIMHGFDERAGLEFTGLHP